MMKNWKKIAALSAVLVVFVAAFIFLNANKAKLSPPSASASPSGTASTEAIKLMDVSRDKINKIVLKREGGDIALTKTEKEIEKLKQKEDGSSEKVKEKAQVWVTDGFDVDTAKIDDIALAAETGTTQRLIDENPADVSIFGLDKPVITTLYSTEGKEYTIEIGNKTPTNDGYYVRKGGSTAVYTIDSYKGDTLSYGKFDIMSKIFYDTQAATFEDLTALTYTKDGTEMFTASVDSSKTWNFTAPYKHKVDTEDFSKFLTWLSGVSVTKYIEENPADLKVYGLDKPKYIFNYTLRGKNYILKVGSLKDTEYYAQLEGKPYVFTLDASKLTFMDLSLMDLSEPFIYIPNINDVEKLVIEMDGRVDELLIKSDQDSQVEEYTFNGTKLTEENFPVFKRYYQGAIAFSGTKLDLTAKPSGKAEIRLTYTMEMPGTDGKVVTVECIPTSDGYGYYLMKNGEYSGMVMSGRQLDKEDMIRTAYKNLVDALNKK